MFPTWSRPEYQLLIAVGATYLGKSLFFLPKVQGIGVREYKLQDTKITSLSRIA